MTLISNEQEKKCTRCGSTLVDLEWDEHVNAREVQNLWHCCNCNNEFITVVASDDEQPSVPQIIKPFFTSLVME
jgi:DNA-directed RNA polymerase subunit RPC12/RpoP